MAKRQPNGHRAIAAALRQIKQARRLRTADMAAATGISGSALTNWMLGVSMPSPDQLGSFARTMRISRVEWMSLALALGEAFLGAQPGGDAAADCDCDALDVARVDRGGQDSDGVPC